MPKLSDKKIIAITGNIASGKSSFTEFLISKGYYIIDTDKLTKEMYESNLEYRDKLVKLLGDDIIVNKKIDKEKVSEIVFSNKELLNKINEIAHPIIKKETIKMINNGPSLVFVDVPLLFEAKFDDIADEIILITIDEDLQKERLMNRNNLDEKQAMQRIMSQVAQDHKIKKATYIVDNSKDLKSLYKKIDEVLLKIERGN